MGAWNAGRVWSAGADGVAAAAAVASTLGWRTLQLADLLAEFNTNSVRTSALTQDADGFIVFTGNVAGVGRSNPAVSWSATFRVPLPENLGYLRLNPPIWPMFRVIPRSDVPDTGSDSWAVMGPRDGGALVKETAWAYGGVFSGSGKRFARYTNNATASNAVNGNNAAGFGGALFELGLKSYGDGAISNLHAGGRVTTLTTAGIRSSSDPVTVNTAHTVTEDATYASLIFGISVGKTLADAADFLSAHKFQWNLGPRLGGTLVST